MVSAICHVIISIAQYVLQKMPSKYQKSRFWIFLFACLFWLLFGIVFSKDAIWMGLANPIAGIYALLAIYYIWKFERFAKKAKQLIEFKDHGTINGVNAHKL